MLALAVAAVVVAPLRPVLATEFVVGDENGWKNNNFDYKAWAGSKEFHVGDKLIFKYRPGAHNVYKVDGAGFQQCKAPENSTSLSSGNDEVTLSSPGKKWYICGVGTHCQSGMKLVINVLPAGGVGTAPSQPPTPAPSAAASKFAA
nr:basic blue protein-like [Ipomoea batatas]